MAEQSDSTWTESRFRQRLVGASVVVALAVLLLPLWLDGSGIDSLRVEPVPEKPEIARTDPDEIPQPPGDTGEPLENPPTSLFPDQSSVELRAGSHESVDEGAAPEDSVDEGAAPERPVETTTTPTEDESVTSSDPDVTPEKAETSAAKADEEADGAPDEPEESAPASSDAEDEGEADTAEPSLPETTRQGDFVVQLGSFSDESNARALAESVEASGFDVSIEPLFSEQGTVWRVRVGPYATRDLATEATERLRQRIGRDGLVMTR
ncbi:SPOR domain-containing protein [Guyparkeria sp.]|uniref:SPOR domain-containing protein n=1 Tax=Guyparkeria sp. TaxID=2035736 RepID=UPI0035612B42